MQLIDGQPVFSATDLVGFLACDHLLALELAGAKGLVRRPIREDPELDLIAQRGLQHEERYRASLEQAGRRITTIERDDTIGDRGERLRKAAAETAAALLATTARPAHHTWEPSGPPVPGASSP